MKIRPLVINDAVRSQAATILAHAKTNVMGSQKVMAAMRDKQLAAGNNPSARMIIPFGYRVVYSLEEQPVQGLCHHISISVEEVITPKPPAAKILPSEEAVNAILDLFGIKKPVQKCLFIWIEDIDDGGGGAINIIDKVEEEL